MIESEYKIGDRVLYVNYMSGNWVTGVIINKIPHTSSIGDWLIDGEYTGTVYVKESEMKNA